MKLLSIGSPPENSSVAVYRQESPLVSFCLFLGMVGVTGGIVYAAFGMLEHPLLMKMLAIPALGLGALFAFVFSVVMLQVTIASTKPTNWLAGVSERGLFLNLRSARNPHFPADTETVATFAWSEVKSVATVNEMKRERYKNRTRITTTRYIEIELTHSETAELQAAIEAERTLEAMPQQILGFKSTGKHYHVPVFVVAPDRVRLVWNSELFENLSGRVAESEEQKIKLDEMLEALSPEEQVKSLAIRGLHMQAVRHAEKEMGLEKGQAKEFVNTPIKQAA